MKKLIIRLTIDILRIFVDLYKIVKYLVDMVVNSLKKVKTNTWRKINALVFIALTILLMIYVYFEWSKFGEYTCLSFFASCIIHGGFGMFLLYCFDSLIVKMSKK